MKVNRISWVEALIDLLLLLLILWLVISFTDITNGNCAANNNIHAWNFFNIFGGAK